MNNTINAMNNVNFTARLAVSPELKAMNPKMDEVAKMFERKTSDYPNDTFEINDTYFYLDDENKCYGKEMYFTEDGSEKLMSYKPKTITNKLEKMFRMMKKEFELATATSDLANKLDIMNTKEISEENFQAFWPLMLDMRKEKIDNALNKDPFMNKYIERTY